MEPVDLYRRMFRARALELAIADLWRRGLISGEMHLGTGEEAVAAGVTAHLADGDAVAVDHRSTPVLSMVGVDLKAMIEELLGRETGLNHGAGGHMHLLEPERLAASSGIVGAAGPTAAGFALAAKLLRPGCVAVAFFGEGATNEGMLSESWTLAAAWTVPVVFVGRANRWASSTRSATVTGGDLVARASGFGLEVTSVDGADPQAVWQGAKGLIDRARRGKGPSFLHATCPRLDGHFLGDPMIKTAQSPVAEGGEVFSKVISAALSRDGGSIGRRASSMAKMMSSLVRVRGAKREGGRDPVERAKRSLEREGVKIDLVESEVLEEIETAVAGALEGGGEHAHDAL